MNKAVVRRWIDDVQNRGDIGAVDDYLTPDYVDHTVPPGFPADREGVKLVLMAIRSAFPDLRVEIHEQVAEGDRVVTRKTFSGTHLGSLFGIPPTGRPASWLVIDILRLVDGRIAEHWSVTDELGALRQLGLISLPGPPVDARP